MKHIEEKLEVVRGAGRATKHRQAGATLLVSMIFLVLMTLFAVTTFNIGKGNLQVVDNRQRHNEAMAAAQEAIEDATSTTRLFESPNNIYLKPCSGSNTKCMDTNGDGKTDVVVRLTPAPNCVKAATVKNISLDVTKSDDAGCLVGAAQSFGVAGAVTGDSLCSDSLWEINAEAVDTQTQAKVVVTQGVAVRVSTDNIATSCP